MVNSADMLAAEIVKLCEPEQIWLYNKKTDLTGKVTSFKLCIVTRKCSRAEVEKKVYLSLDCDVPYDLTVYSCTDWDSACSNPDSFARSILMRGKKLYGKTS